MTRYSRSDVLAVNPADGCPPGHTREPGPDGTYTGHWVLDCLLCEVALANDPHWAGDPSDVPPTPAEEKAKKKLAEQGQNNAAQMAAFFGQMMQAFQMQQQGMPQQPQAPAPVVVACVSCGVPGMQGARFCASCGTPVTIAGSALPSDALAVLAAPDEGGQGSPARETNYFGETTTQQAETATDPVADPQPPDLAALTLVQLRAKAKAAGLPQSGSKTALVARLTEAAIAG